MKKQHIIPAIFLVVMGMVAGYGAHSVFVPPVEVDTQQVKVVTQEVQPTEQFSCKVVASFVDPTRTFIMTETVTCNSLPNKVRMPTHAR